MALGRLGLSYDEFLDYTPRSFYNKLKGINDMREEMDRSDWERARWMSTLIINPHVKKTIRPKDLALFPWEKKEVKNNNTKEDVLRLVKIIEEKRKFKQ